MLKIVKDNKPSLRMKCSPVTLPLDSANEKLILEMVDYLKKSQDQEYAQKHEIREGVGLAAPQVGVNKRMLVIYYPTTTESGEAKIICHALINPTIISASVKKVYLKSGEGCLSVDKIHDGYVYRNYKIIVQAYDAIKKQDVMIVAREYEAIVLQHEIDHLNGILFYDHIDSNDPFRVLEDSVGI